MIPAWTLFFFVPGAWTALGIILPWLSAALLIFTAYALLSEGCLWIEHLLTRAAKALPACWLFDGAARPPVKPQRVTTDDGPSASQYHSIDGWHEAYKAWEAGKPIPFNAHNKSWRYGDDSY